MKMETVRYSKTLVPYYIIRWYYSQKGHNLKENLHFILSVLKGIIFRGSHLNDQKFSH